MKTSAGILLFRRRPGVESRPADWEVFLVHPGGPFFSKKDLGAWSIPKGELSEGEAPLDAAKREFAEETGHTLHGNFIPLAPIKQKGGKTVMAWALEGDIDPDSVRSNTFDLVWPPGSGRTQTYPEIDKAQWFAIEEAAEKINEAQQGFLEELKKL
jgi:predicted NUDIX family NTP pyrophosphohydrolase